MTETLEITTEQINDLPLLLGIVEEMGIRQQIDAQIRPHGHWQGISVGTVVSIWLCHLLMERDHRLVAVRDWAAARTHTLNALLGIQLRDTDLTDDRLANVLTMLSGADDQAAVDQALLADWLRVYALPQQTVRLDSTSVSVYQDANPPDGLIRHGVSKEHRPDLAQFKVMLASLDPLGLPLACHPVPGNRSDDLLYIPAYDAAMQALDTAAVLVVGDNKMAALGTRAHMVRGGSAYLCAYRPSMATAQIAGWVTDALAVPESWQELREVDERTGEISTLAVIAEWERIQWEGETEWTERVLVARSARAQEGLRRRRERMLGRVAEQLAALSRPARQGRRVYRTVAALETAVAELLRAACLEGVVWIQPDEQVRRDGTACWTVRAYGVDLAAWREMVDRLGWHVYLTSTTPEHYDAPTLVAAYRQQAIQERGFARLKTRNLHIRPVYLSDERRIAGLTWLLCVALRVLTLTEYRLRRTVGAWRAPRRPQSGLSEPDDTAPDHRAGDCRLPTPHPHGRRAGGGDPPPCHSAHPDPRAHPDAAPVARRSLRPSRLPSPQTARSFTRMISLHAEAVTATAGSLSRSAAPLKCAGRVTGAAISRADTGIEADMVGVPRLGRCRVVPPHHQMAVRLGLYEPCMGSVAVPGARLDAQWT